MNFTAQNIKIDYHPFGSSMPGRTFKQYNYKYGFNGMEKNNSTSNGIEGANYTTPFRMLDTRLGGRWWSQDPIVHPWSSPYVGFADNPVYFSDPSGLGVDPPGNDEPTQDEGAEACKNDPKCHYEPIPKKDDDKPKKSETKTEGDNRSGSEKGEMIKTVSGPGDRNVNYKGHIVKDYGVLYENNYKPLPFEVTWENNIGEFETYYFISKSSDQYTNVNLGLAGALEKFELKAVLGGDAFNIHGQATGKYLMTDNSLNIGIYQGQNGHTGFKAGAELMAYIFSGKAEGGVTISILTIDLSASAYAGGGSIGGAFRAYYDKNQNVIVISGMENLGLVIGQRTEATFTIEATWFKDKYDKIINYFNNKYPIFFK